MIYRMKILLALTQELSGMVEEEKFPLYLFLFCYEFSEHNHYYHFIPTASGPRSLQAEEDKRYLTHKKLYTESNDWVTVENSKRYAVDLDFFEKMAIQKMKNQLSGASQHELLSRITTHHPYYIKNTSLSRNDTLFCTIGYEGLSQEQYVNKLLEHDIKVLCDVRKNPISKKYGFSKSELANLLPEVGIEYYHIPELGIASDKRQNLQSDSDYEILFKDYTHTVLPKQQAKLDLLEAMLNTKQRIAITCFEANIYHCHRSKITQALRERSTFLAPVKHL